MVRPDDPPEARWAAAVALGARGRYAAACALLDRLRLDPATPPAIRAHATVTRAAHLRQHGGHRAARRWDGHGLALATAAGLDDRADRGVGTDPGAARCDGTDAAAARVDAVLGLAADALGLGDLVLSARLLAEVEGAAAEHPSWRPPVRWRWVSAELALARDEPARAVGLAADARDRSRAAGAVRHEIKSELILVVARRCTGEPAGRVSRSLGRLTERTIVARLDSLEWPMRLLSGDMLSGPDPATAGLQYRRLAELRASIRRSTDPLGRLVADHSPWVSDVSEA